MAREEIQKLAQKDGAFIAEYARARATKVGRAEGLSMLNEADYPLVPELRLMTILKMGANVKKWQKRLPDYARNRLLLTENERIAALDAELYAELDTPYVDIDKPTPMRSFAAADRILKQEGIAKDFTNAQKELLRHHSYANLLWFCTMYRFKRTLRLSMTFKDDTSLFEEHIRRLQVSLKG
ncbi:hypothetical protein PRK78_003401 [Emydomyces testavorans]|uniref:Uncharacterized protein n=1 Tax=Emydomyces testavorans TaxID=2070801 RepID=A0AAF0DGU0_9EURO|nr:hypothetical protein PRK78_003401 [Emydomyces testavorans]